MLLKILGTADILTALSLVIIELLPKVIVTILAAYLIIKSLFFIITGDRISLIDLICGLYLFIAANGFSYWVISLIVMIYIGQKGIISILS